MKEKWGHVQTVDDYMDVVRSCATPQTKWYVCELKPSDVKAYTIAYKPHFKSLSRVNNTRSQQIFLMLSFIFQIQYFPAKILRFSANPAYVEEITSYTQLGFKRRIYLGNDSTDYKPVIKLIREQFELSDFGKFDFDAVIRRPKVINPFIGLTSLMPDHLLGILRPVEIKAVDKV
jgi:hypothetical protein